MTTRNVTNDSLGIGILENSFLNALESPAWLLLPSPIRTPAFCGTRLIVIEMKWRHAEGTDPCGHLSKDEFLVTYLSHQ